MKKINFFKIGSLKSEWMLLACFIFLPIGYLTHFRFSEWLVFLGYIFLSLHFGRAFFYRNYARWNSLGIQLKLNKFLFNMIPFKNIEGVNLVDDNLVIKTNKKTFAYSSENVDKTDLNKLVDIIKSHVNK